MQGSKGRGRSWGKRKELRGEKNKRERERENKSEREGRRAGREQHWRRLENGLV